MAFDVTQFSPAKMKSLLTDEEREEMQQNIQTYTDQLDDQKKVASEAYEKYRTEDRKSDALENDLNEYKENALQNAFLEKLQILGAQRLQDAHEPIAIRDLNPSGVDYDNVTVEDITRNTSLDKTDLELKMKGYAGKGTLPFGFQRDNSGMIQVNEKEAAVVSKLFDLAANPDNSYADIAEECFGKWYRDSKAVTDRLYNRKYISECFYDNKVYRMGHDPLVTTQQWNDAQAVRGKSAPCLLNTEIIRDKWNQCKFNNTI